MRDRTDALADELEQAAAELRADEARLYGYRVRRDPRERERGVVAYSGGRLTFEIEHPEGWFAPDAE